jgi:hypothetical protein
MISQPTYLDPKGPAQQVYDEFKQLPLEHDLQADIYAALSTVSPAEYDHLRELAKTLNESFDQLRRIIPKRLHAGRQPSEAA